MRAIENHLPMVLIYVKHRPPCLFVKQHSSKVPWCLLLYPARTKKKVVKNLALLSKIQPVGTLECVK